MDGFLLIDKPVGISSFGVVARVRRVLSVEAGKKVKVGHTGTLDPAAEGLMILVIGSYCKRASEFSKLDKVYEVEMTLGATSSTDDSEGVISKTRDGRSKIEDGEILRVIKTFVGDILQVPPIYSAIKVEGQRAYKLARAGKVPEMKPRPVSIYKITNIEVNADKVRFMARVSSGTYIRSLVRDIGVALGCGAYMSGLRRTKVGNYSIQQAIELNDNLNFAIVMSGLKQGEIV